MAMAKEIKFNTRLNVDGKEQLATATTSITSTGAFPNFQMAKT